MVKRPYTYFLQVLGTVDFSRPNILLLAGASPNTAAVSWRIGDTASEPTHVKTVF